MLAKTMVLAGAASFAAAIVTLAALGPASAQGMTIQQATLGESGDTVFRAQHKSE